MRKKLTRVILLAFLLLDLCAARAGAMEHFLFLSDGMPEIRFGTLSRDRLTELKGAQIEVIGGGVPYAFSASFSRSFSSESGEYLSGAGLTLEVTGVFTGETGFRGPVSLSRAEKIFYVSDDAGSPETFSLILTLAIPPEAPAGEYSGSLTLLYYENEIEVEEQEVDISFTVASYLDIKLLNASGMPVNTINFRPLLNLDETATEEFIFQIETNIYKPYKVTQSIYEPFINDRNRQEIDSPDFLSYRLFGDSIRGELYTNYQCPLSYSEDLLYLSDEEGGSDSFRIFYYLNNTSRLTYGEYSNFLTFQVVPSDKITDFESRELKVAMNFEIKRILDIKVSPVEGQGGLDFGVIKRGDPMSVQTLKVVVQSNTGNPYVVSQEFIQPIVSLKGHVFKEQGCFIKVHGGEEGKKLIQEFETMPTSRMELYRSNDKGDSDSFFVTYGIKPEDSVIGGKYSSGINFTVEEVIK
ncbi:MAG: hypothetical protein JW928_08020 [Candidatus Aureabacteria bacterium]|nr:hypothetical protein [Candidatus Auribacterota bacterium]